jgi:hypothetical protein
MFHSGNPPPQWSLSPGPQTRATPMLRRNSQRQVTNQSKLLQDSGLFDVWRQPMRSHCTLHSCRGTCKSTVWSLRKHSRTMGLCVCNTHNHTHIYVLIKHTFLFCSYPREQQNDHRHHPNKSVEHSVYERHMLRQLCLDTSRNKVCVVHLHTHTYGRNSGLHAKNLPILPNQRLVTLITTIAIITAATLLT